MASTDARPVPQKNVAYRITFPIFDADGDPVTGASGLDSEVSKDAGTFADCTNEATEIATSSGIYYLDLTSTEMNADTVAICVKTSTSGAKTTVIVLYPEETGDIRVNATAMGGTTLTARDIGASVLLSSGTGTGQVTLTSGRVNADITHIATAAVSTSTAQLGVNVVNFGGSAGTFASGRPAVNASYIGGVPVTATTSITFPSTCTVATTTGAVGSVTGDVGGNVTGSVGSISGITFPTNFSTLGINASGHVSRVVLCDTITTYTGNTVQTGDSFARIGATGSGLTSLAPASTALSTATWTGARAGYIDNLSAGAVATAANLATVDDFLDTEIAAIKAVTDKIDTALELDSTVYRFTVNALENAPSGGGGGLDAAGVRAAIGLASANLDTQLTAIDDFLDTEIAAIKAKTDNLPSDPADASDIATAFGTVNTKLDTIDDFLDTEIAAIKAKTDNLPASPAASGDIPAASTVASAVRTELGTELGRIDVAISTRGTGAALDAAGVRAAIGLASANLDTQLTAIDDFLDTEIAAIKAKTDNLPSDPADASDISTAFGTVNTKLDTIDDFLDTEIAAIKAKTDNLPASPAASGDIPAASTVASAVRTELGTELGRIDVAISTRGTGAALDAAGVRSAVGLASANLDTQLADIPTVSEFEARTIVSANYATAANLATVAGYLDTEIAAILEDTGTTIPAQIAALSIPAASTVASAVRTELATELGRIDVAISTRGTGSNQSTIITHLTDIKGATFNGSTDSLEAIRDRGDSAWTTATSVTVSDKTGFKLASDGLDSISTTAPAGVAANFREMLIQVWRRFFRKVAKSASDIKTYADNGSTVLTTQTISESGDDQTQGAAN